MVAVVRKEFDVPGVREGTVLPDYRKAVGISTVAAQRELMPVGIIVVLIPVIVGFTFKAEALGGFLAGVILSGQLLAVFMSNAGGAWDNAKKLVEEGHYGGKGSDAHKASIVGDTVGDPLKDTAGPALNPLIKVINLISLIIAPIVVSSNTLRYRHRDRHGRLARRGRVGHQPQQAAGSVRDRSVGPGQAASCWALPLGSAQKFKARFDRSAVAAPSP